ncbi:MAG: ParB/RepB/Spo0J family partition protein [Candidatus Krumholzibacteriia bacterium]
MDRRPSPLAGLAPVVGELLEALRGRPEPLVPFEEVRRGLALTHMIDRGIVQVPVAAITGSLGRTRDFDQAFLPRDDEHRRRLAELRQVAERQGFPPIDLYRVGDAYFVVDGHHRVALAREMGAGEIEAHVREFPTEVAVAPGDDLDEVLTKAARHNFQQATGLDDAAVDALSPSSPAGFDRLLEHIAVHRYYLGTRLGREPGWDEAVDSWRRTVYEPVVRVIRQRDLLREFPGRGESDLYLWLSDRLHALRQEYGDSSLPPEQAIPARPRWRRWWARVRG